jgi:predicted phage terminase large subunit-like protein
VQVAHYAKLLKGFGFIAKPISGDKVTRSGPFASQVNVGNVAMVRAEWNAHLVSEYRVFNNGTWDDQVDAGSDAFTELEPVRLFRKRDLR